MKPKNKKINQQSLVLTIITLITVLAWVGFEVYWAYNKTEIETDIRRQLTPLNPTLEEETIKNLTGREEPDLSQISNLVEETERPAEIAEEEETPGEEATSSSLLETGLGEETPGEATSESAPE